MALAGFGCNLVDDLLSRGLGLWLVQSAVAAGARNFDSRAII
jgi:hypothetical protein